MSGVMLYWIEALLDGEVVAGFQLATSKPEAVRLAKLWAGANAKPGRPAKGVPVLSDVRVEVATT